MKKYTITENAHLSNDELQQLCIDQAWFDLGSNRQYDKLFRMNSEGADLDTLASMIYMCTDGVPLPSIKATLEELTTAKSLWDIYLGKLDEDLSRMGWGQTEREIICEALRSHQDNGTSFRTNEE